MSKVEHECPNCHRTLNLSDLEKAGKMRGSLLGYDPSTGTYGLTLPKVECPGCGQWIDPKTRINAVS